MLVSSSRVVARRLSKQKSNNARFEAKNAGYQKIRRREARKMLKKANLIKRSVNSNGRFGI